MPVSSMRKFSTEFKHGVILRLLAGESLAGLSAELGIRRKSLYEWRNAFRDHGVEGFNRQRGPKAGAARQPRQLLPPPDPGPGASPADELAHARARIAELERKIGRQQMDLDFFRAALRLTDVERMEPSAPSPAATRSMRSSTK